MIFGEGFPCDFQVRNTGYTRYTRYTSYTMYTALSRAPHLDSMWCPSWPAFMARQGWNAFSLPLQRRLVAPRDQLALRDMQKNNQKHRIKKVECFQKPLRGKNMFKVILLAPPTLASAAPLSFWGTEGVSGGLPIHPRKVLPWMKHHILFCTVLHDAVYCFFPIGDVFDVLQSLASGCQHDSDTDQDYLWFSWCRRPQIWAQNHRRWRFNQVALNDFLAMATCQTHTLNCSTA